MTKIEWTEKTWNPIVGCSIVSPGCTNCYAMKMAARLERIDAAERAAGRNGLPHYAGLTKTVNGNAVWTGKLALAPEHILAEPLRRKKPAVYFVNSMSDLFHDDVPDAWIDRVFAVMALSPQHTFQVLTKRSKRMRDYVRSISITHPDVGSVSYPPEKAVEHRVQSAAAEIGNSPCASWAVEDMGWPLPNVWLGVSAERQQEADARIPDLLATPAAVRFVSAEPLLGPIDFSFIGNAKGNDGAFRYNALTGHALPWGGVIAGAGVWQTNEDKVRPCAKLDWVIVGGESGANARPMHPEWVRSIRDQCCGRDDRLHLTGLPDVAFFFKQWGEWLPVRADRFGGDDGGKTYWPHDCVDPSDTSKPLGKIKTGWADLGYQIGSKMDLLFGSVGKARAGRLLDGIEHNDMPSATAPSGRLTTGESEGATKNEAA